VVEQKAVVGQKTVVLGSRFSEPLRREPLRGAAIQQNIREKQSNRA
jgi:hypothetical protein